MSGKKLKLSCSERTVKNKLILYFQPHINLIIFSKSSDVIWLICLFVDLIFIKWKTFSASYDLNYFVTLSQYHVGIPSAKSAYFAVYLPSESAPYAELCVILMQTMLLLIYYLSSCCRSTMRMSMRKERKRCAILSRQL